MAGDSEVVVLVTVTNKMRTVMKKLLSSKALTDEQKLQLAPYSKHEMKDMPARLVKEMVKIHTELFNEIYIHELLEGSEIALPKYEPPPRSPELEARIQRLKVEQSNREYRLMTKNVTIRSDNSGLKSFGDEMQSVQRMLITIFNFVLTVGGSFVFAYKATEYAMMEPNVALQMCAGLTVGTIVFFADLYFLMRHEIFEEEMVLSTQQRNKILTSQKKLPELT